ncbi:STAS domain-containing protein [Cellulomonas persica]|uniref:STAS domain-containing protein n=1 Tax=Cellulomonas persica TaxID=76861 RepID=UPI001FED76A5|nr:STAS domain-containing protein [Cellulomonas persica]
MTSEEAVVDVAGEIGVEAEPGCTVVRLVGEIDVALREQASRSMITALTSDGAIVIDASAVTFIDSSGIAFVLQLLHAAREAGIDVTLRDPDRAVSSVLEIVGAASLLPQAAVLAGDGPARAGDEVVAAPIG